MKQKSSLLLMVLIITIFSVRSHSALLSLEPSNANLEVGDALSVDLRISQLGADILTAFDLDITFDDSVLDFTGFTFADPTFGDQLDFLGIGGGLFRGLTPSVGSVNVADLSFDPDAILQALQQDDFILGTLSFTAESVGTSVLGFQNEILSGAFNGGFVATPLTFTTNSSSVSVIAQSIDEPISILLLSVGLLGLLSIRRIRHNA